MIDALGVQVPPPRELTLALADESNADLHHVKEQIEIQWQPLISAARSFGWSRGLTFVNQHGEARPIPLTIFPTPVPRECFHQAIKLSPLFSRLAFGSVLNFEYMLEALKSCSVQDELTARLVAIANRVYGGEVKQRDVRTDIFAGIMRNDYLMTRSQDDSQQMNLRQVELNTIAVAFAGHATVLREFHRLSVEAVAGRRVSPKEFPENEALTNVGKALVATVDAYCERYGKSSEPPPAETSPVASDRSLGIPVPLATGYCVLFITTPEEDNICDIALVENALHNAWLQKKSSEPLCVFRASIADLVKMMQTKEKDMLASLVLGASAGMRRRPLLMRHPMRRSEFREVACVYFRAGYIREHYGSDAAWDVRELIELSDAVSIPSVLLQLAGSKKLQTLWAVPSILKRFVPDAAARDLMKAVLEDAVDPAEPDVTPKGRDLLQEAVEHPDRFVTKSIREGGQPQFSDCTKAIAEAGVQNRVATAIEELHLSPTTFVIMRKIRPEARVAVMYPSIEEPTAHPSSLLLSVDVSYSLSELGTFDFFLGSADKELRVETLGHLLRTKRATETLGGVSIGAACLDSPWLV